MTTTAKITRHSTMPEILEAVFGVADRVSLRMH